MISMRQIILIAIRDLTGRSFENQLIGCWNRDSSPNSFQKHSKLSNVEKVVSAKHKETFFDTFVLKVEYLNLNNL